MLIYFLVFCVRLKPSIIVMELCLAFQENVSILMDMAQNEHALTALIDVSRLLRGKCDGSADAANLIIEQEIATSISQLCNWFNSSDVRKEFSGFETLNVQKRTLILILCQLLANFSASGEIAHSHLFTLSFDSLSHILSAAVMTENRKAVAAFLNVIYNCLHVREGDEDRETVEQTVKSRGEALAAQRGFVCQLLLAVLDNRKNDLGISKVSADHTVSAEDPALEWFHMLAFLWFKQNLFADLFRITSPTIECSMANVVHITHEQVHINPFYLCVHPLTTDSFPVP